MEIVEILITDLKPNPRITRRHPRLQIRRLARSIESFGFNNPLLIDDDNQIIAGHGQYMAAKEATGDASLETLPCVRLSRLSANQRRAFAIVDNLLMDLLGGEIFRVGDGCSASESPSPNTDYRQLDRDKLSEIMRRYIDVKYQYPHALLFFRVGDFFECFFQDAVTISQELELVQTTKSAGKEVGRVPMTGVPFEHVYRYSNMLVEKGYSVVICDQVEDAAIAAKERRQVRREVTRILT